MTKDCECLCIQEISQKDFCDHIEDEDFCIVYGNPIVINCDRGTKLLAVAWPLWKRLMKAAGRELEIDAVEEAVRRVAEQETEITQENGEGNG